MVFHWKSQLVSLSLKGLLWGLLSLLMVACQPTNTKVGKKLLSSINDNNGNTVDPNLLAVRITDTSQTPFTGASLAVNAGDTLSLRAGLFKLDNTPVEDVDHHQCLQWQ